MRPAAFKFSFHTFFSVFGNPVNMSCKIIVASSIMVAHHHILHSDQILAVACTYAERGIKRSSYEGADFSVIDQSTGAWV